MKSPRGVQLDLVLGAELEDRPRGRRAARRGHRVLSEPLPARLAPWIAKQPRIPERRQGEQWRRILEEGEVDPELLEPVEADQSLRAGHRAREERERAQLLQARERCEIGHAGT